MSARSLLDDLLRDLAYGVRTLVRNPGFTMIALLSLAVGIGANAGIFSLVDQVLLRELRGVKEPERLAVLNWNGRDLSTSYGGGPLMSYPLCRDLQQQTMFFDGVFCRHPTNVNLSTGRQHEPVRAEIVSGSYFSVLGVLPAFGRLIDESDDREPGAHPVVVLSFDYWRTNLGEASDVIGRRVLLNNYPMTVIGIAPASFRGVDVADVPAVWIPAAMKRQATPEWDRLLERRVAWMHVFARLKPGVTTAQAQTGLQPWFASMLQADAQRADFPPAPAERVREFLASTLDVQPASRGQSNLRSVVERPLWVLMAGTSLLLLLAISNVAGLLLARGAARIRELTTRMALGASRGRITRQLLVESLLVTVGGGLLGLLATPVVTRVLVSFLGREADLSTRVDQRILGFTFLASIVAGVLCGLAPAFQTRRMSFNERAHVAMAGTRVRKTLVVCQIAVTLILLTGAGLFLQTVARLHAQAPESSDRVVMFSLDPQSIGYPDSRARQFMHDMQRTLQTLPAVDGVAVANTSLLTGGSFARALTIQSDRRITSDRNAYGLRVTPGFFSTLGTRLIAGRDFDDRDTRAADDTAGYRSVIVNESFARRYFNGRNPVGSYIGLSNRPDTPTNIEIIGLVEDISYRSLRLTESEHIFLPFWDAQAENGAFYVKVRGQPESAFSAIRAAVAEMDPMLPVESLRSFDEQIDRSLTNERMLATLSSGFGAMALLLSMVGLYGVMAYVAARRTQEIGVRLALGATRRAAVWLVLQDALVMVVAGAALAIPLALSLRRLVEAQLFGVQAFDASTLAAAGGGLTMIALGAATLPAWRAALVPPMMAIRDQPESLWHAARVSARRTIRGLTARSEPALPSLSLVDEFTGMVQRATSFSDALRVALPALRQRMGARFILLLEKASNDVYRGDDLSIPSRGILLNRLTHYRHPLPLTPADFDAWLAWASASRPAHVDEIEKLRNSGARIAVALRTRREIVGVILLGPPETRDAFTDGEKQILSSAAELFALMIENARLNHRALEQENVRRDLALAAEVQRRLLPPQPPASAIATLAAFTLPARSVGGDFYDFVECSDSRIGIAIADVAGKGIAAALLTSVVQASLRVISVEHDQTSSQLAAKMNRFLYRSTSGSNYATFFYAQLDAGRMRYVNAGHNPPYLVRRTPAGVEMIELSAGGTVLGLFPEVPYEDAEVALMPGDLFVGYTDGVTEARNPEGEEFGEDRLKAFLQDAVGRPAGEVSSMLAEQMRDWIAGAEQHDDLTFVVATVL